MFRRASNDGRPWVVVACGGTWGALRLRRAYGVLIALLAATAGLTGCGVTAPSASPKTSSSHSATATSVAAPTAVPNVDPQILSDVAAGAFPLPGPSELRTIRITLASIGFPNAACGGRNFANLNNTSFRFDQARYADLNLIAKKGLSEPELRQPARVNAACRARKVPAFSRWYALSALWQDATLTAADSSPVVATHARTAACLHRVTQLTVSAGDPTASYLNSVDYALSGLKSRKQSKTLERRFSLAYARCTTSYFAALGAQLRPVKARLIERNRELLEQYASELAALGYVP